MSRNSHFFEHWQDVPRDFWRWPDFSPEEIACRGTGKLLVDEAAMDALQALRNHLGRPMIVNSAYRSPEHNTSVRGAPRSKHLEGVAFDISMANHHPDDFVAAARACGFRGIGFYPRQNFIHVDLGPARQWGETFLPRSTRFAPEEPAPGPAAPPPKPAPAGDRRKALVRAIQTALVAAGYHEVGEIDGDFATRTRGAILAFQADNDLPLDPEPSMDLLAAILASPRRAVSETRSEGKPTANPALKTSERSWWTGWGIFGVGGMALLEQAVKAVEGGADAVARVRTALAPVLDLWPIGLGAIGLALVLWGLQGKRSIIDDFRSGRLLR